jgi:3-keto-L-gulonate-6-phosphate decarboxylase
MKEIIVIGEVEIEGKVMPASRVIVKEAFDFSAYTVAAMCVVLHNSFEGCLAEDKKEKFSEDFKIVFDKMFDERQQYSLNIENK